VSFEIRQSKSSYRSNCFFTRDSIYAIARICHANSVRPSVCPSVTRVYCVKTADRIIEILSLTDRPIILVFRHQGSLCKSEGVTPNWIEQGLTSPPTQYRLSGRQFYRSNNPTNSIKVLKEKLASHRPEEAPNPPGPPTVLQVNL